MTVDHKAMIENLIAWAKVQMPLAAQSLRQLLDENQSLQDYKNYYEDLKKHAAEMSKKTEAQAKEIERLRELNQKIIDQRGNVEDYWIRLNEDKKQEIEWLKADKAAAVEALRKADKFINAIMSFYGQGMEVIGYHMNDATETWDSFFDNNMDGDELEVIRTTLQRIESGDKDA